MQRCQDATHPMICPCEERKLELAVIDAARAWAETMWDFRRTGGDEDRVIDALKAAVRDLDAS